MKYLTKKQLWFLFAALVALFALPDLASAGTDATFQAAVTTIDNWVNGTLGKLIVAALVIVGVVAGIARQSLMAFAVAIGAGLGLSNATTILNGMFSATLPVIN